MAVIYDGTEEQVSGILQKLEKEVKEFNHMHHGGSEYLEISYACGHAVSTDYPNCSFRVLFACQKTNTGQIMICVHETM